MRAKQTSLSIIYPLLAKCILYAASVKIRPKTQPIYKKTGNLRAVQLLLGHTKMDSTVRYLGVELEDALAISESVEL